MLGATGICVILLIYFSLLYIGGRLGQMQEEREEFRKAANKASNKSPRRRGKRGK